MSVCMHFFEHHRKSHPRQRSRCLLNSLAPVLESLHPYLNHHFEHHGGAYLNHHFFEHHDFLYIELFSACAVLQTWVIFCWLGDLTTGWTREQLTADLTTNPFFSLGRKDHNNDRRKQLGAQFFIICSVARSDTGIQFYPSGFKAFGCFFSGFPVQIERGICVHAPVQSRRSLILLVPKGGSAKLWEQNHVHVYTFLYPI